MNAHADTTMTIRINSEVMHEAQEIFAGLGMDMSTAINEFLSQAIYCGGFPFDARQHEPNGETLAAFEEGERMLHDPSAPRFSSVDELFADLAAQ